MAVDSQGHELSFDALPDDLAQEGADETAQSERRRRRLDPDRVADAPDNGLPIWNRDAFEGLMSRLNQRYPVQARAILRAAANDGWVDRITIFDIGGYDNGRRLNGFTKPTTRIAAQLVRDELLAPGSEPALTTVYEDGTAIGFSVPTIFGKFLP